jgi:hypothetical protein
VTIYCPELSDFIQNIILEIEDSIVDDLREKIAPHFEALINYDATVRRGLSSNKKIGIQGEEDVKFIQASYDLIQEFLNSAKQNEVPEISETLEKIYKALFELAMKLFR